MVYATIFQLFRKKDLQMFGLQLTKYGLFNPLVFGGLKVNSILGAKKGFVNKPSLENEMKNKMNRDLGHLCAHIG